MNPKWKTSFIIFSILFVTSAVWLPCIHLFYKKDITDYKQSDKIAPIARTIANTHLSIWNDPKLRKIELDKMQYNNPEWDFMSRTYFVLALANMALLDNSLLDETCSIIDDIIHNTLETEKNRGFKYFLLEYGKGGGWVNYPEGSIFVDGEIALMIGARRALQEKEEYKKLQYNRINKIKSRMRQSSILCDESYPNECWLFCNTVALAAIKISDKLDGTDHSKFFASWIQSAKDNLIDKQTGLLISAFTVNARPLPTGPGPEGSSIWMASHMLQIIDEDFANDQYKRAKQELAGKLFGFAYAREFPKGFDGEADVDYGP